MVAAGRRPKPHSVATRKSFGAMMLEATSHWMARSL
jgi:hypothetical protein